MPATHSCLVIELHHPSPGPVEAAGASWGESAARCYWPFVRSLVALASEGHRAPLAVAVSPSWIALASDPVATRVTSIYLDDDIRPFVDDAHGGNLLDALRLAADAAQVELLPMSSSFAWLPSVAGRDPIAAAQVRLAAANFRAAFGRAAQGLWLPHLAYAPGLETHLAGCGLRYFATDADAFRRGTVQPPQDLAGPLVTRAGVAAFGVDPEPARLLVGSSADGDDNAARDQGHQFAHAWRDGLSTRGRLADPAFALIRLDVHELTRSGPSGLARLEHAVRARSRFDTWAPLTPASFLDRHPDGPLGRPGTSSGGWPAVLPGGSDLFGPLRPAADVLADALARRANLTPTGRRAVAQMTRHLLLAQALDWHLPLASPVGPEAGVGRARAHMAAFAELAATLYSGRVDRLRLADLEAGPAYLAGLDLDALAAA
jgi:predicted glycosyl hydrolase (DUF1957 family)